MPRLNGFCAGGELLKDVVSKLGDNTVEEIKSRCDGEKLKSVFEDAELLSTCFALFENDLNVSLTARKLYMHRNTLIYRINKIEKACGLNVSAFNDAVTFLLLYGITCKNSKRIGGGKNEKAVK